MKRWTSEEIEFLKDNFMEMSNGELANKLKNRSKNAVKLKLSELGLSRQKWLKPRFELDDWQKPYMAGLIDGEGWIGFRTKSPCPRPTVHISNLNEFFAEEIRNWFEDIPFYEQSDSYRIFFSRLADIKKILEDTLPYLALKEKQAEFVLKFVNSRLDRPRASELTDEEVKIAQKCSEINQNQWVE